VGPEAVVPGDADAGTDGEESKSRRSTGGADATGFLTLVRVLLDFTERFGGAVAVRNTY
jgi:hypothetical protein